jgi:hypothetical protein
MMVGIDPATGLLNRSTVSVGARREKFHAWRDRIGRRVRMVGSIDLGTAR